MIEEYSKIKCLGFMKNKMDQSRTFTGIKSIYSKHLGLEDDYLVIGKQNWIDNVDEEREEVGEE